MPRKFRCRWNNQISLETLRNLWLWSEFPQYRVLKHRLDQECFLVARWRFATS